MTGLESWVDGFIAAERDPERIDAWVRRTWAAIETDVPQLATIPGREELGELIRVAIGEHWRAFLDHLSGEGDFRLVPTAAELARELPRRHLDLTLLLAIYRAAQRSSWTYATEVVREAPAGVDHEEVLVLFWTEAAAWLDASVEESLVLHQREAAQIQQRGDAQRFEAVRGVLEGRDGAELDPRELSAALGGYPATGSHVALVLTALTPDALATLEPAARRIAARFGARAPLIVRPSGREAWCWVPSERARPTEPRSAEAVELDPAQLRVTIAGPHAGLDGFVLAHNEARAAQVVALAGRTGLTAYDDVAALCLLALDPAAATRFARRVLGPLADARHGKLRETVRVVLTTPGGSEAVGGVLGVHKNTVRYRIGQAERLLGGPIQERARDLLLALDYAETFLLDVRAESPVNR
ncbi:MAG: helix-turn-helix domain-containing protein [Nocardioides sp.]|uniref:PucR family transcriptional regulator n=1 Tax=Nocardioides sp. TaxID=35761 RepID=UPI0039E3596D